MISRGWVLWWHTQAHGGKWQIVRQKGPTTTDKVTTHRQDNMAVKPCCFSPDYPIHSSDVSVGTCLQKHSVESVSWISSNNLLFNNLSISPLICVANQETWAPQNPRLILLPEFVLESVDLAGHGIIGLGGLLQLSLQFPAGGSDALGLFLWLLQLPLQLLHPGVGLVCLWGENTCKHRQTFQDSRGTETLRDTLVVFIVL